MGLFYRYKKKTHSERSEKKMFFEWLDTTLMVELSSEVKAIIFNLYEDEENKWSIELSGTSVFDENDDDWACCEVFSTRDNPFVIELEGDWQTIEEIFTEWVNDYLGNGAYAGKLKKYEAVGMGFVDGDLTILFKR